MMSDDINGEIARLKAENDMLRAAEEIGGSGSYKLTLSDLSVCFSDGLFRMFGCEPRSFVPSLEFIEGHSHPDDVNIVRKIIMKAAVKGSDYVYRRRIFRADGEMRTVESNAVCVFKNGKPHHYVGYVTDITDFLNREQELLEQANYIKAVNETIPDMISVTHHPGREIEYSNHDVLEMLGFNSMEIAELSRKQRVALIHPEDGHRLTDYYNRFENLSDTDVNQLLYRISNRAGKWVWLSVRGKVLARDENGKVLKTLHVGTDITYEVEAEHALMDNNALLQSVFDTSLIQMSVMKAVRNAAGEIEDFVIMLTNPELDKETGRKDLVGKKYAEEYPGIRVSGLFAAMLEVVETGRPAKMDYFYPYEGFGKWYSCQFVKNGDGLVCTNLDITDKKMAEQERYHNFELLRATLDSTLDVIEAFKAVRDERGSIKDFIWILTNGEWSKKQPDVIGKSLLEVNPSALTSGLFDKLVKAVETGEPSRMERLYQDVHRNGWFNEAIVKMDDGAVVATEDITERKRSEQELLNLKLSQQKAIINAIIAAQEDERIRMGESLHNGVAQLLYAIQMRLQLLEDTSSQQEKIRELLSITAEAIRDTRGIAFELVPALLRDFGVEQALKALLQKIVPPQLKVSFIIRGLGKKLPEQFETSVYRIVQELVNNVIRHANASIVLIELLAEKGTLRLCVRDNGIGLSPAVRRNPRSGIGLQSIRNRVSLLDGLFSIEDVPRGTMIMIFLPLPEVSR